MTLQSIWICSIIVLCKSFFGGGADHSTAAKICWLMFEHDAAWESVKLQNHRLGSSSLSIFINIDNNSVTSSLFSLPGGWRRGQSCVWKNVRSPSCCCPSVCTCCRKEGQCCQPVDHSSAGLSALSRLAAIASVFGPRLAQIPAFYQIPQPNHVVSSAFSPPTPSLTGEPPSRRSENSIEHFSIFCSIGGKVICTRRGLLV